MSLSTLQATPVPNKGNVMAQQRRIIFDAFKALISVRETSAKSLSEMLKSNIHFYKSLLKNPAFQDVLQTIEHQRSTWPAVDSIELDADLLLYNEFCCEAVSMIAVLNDLTSSQQTECITAKDKKVPSAPVMLISVSEEKVLNSVTEFVVCLGLYPYLLPGADTILKLRLKRAESVVKAGDICRSFRDHCLYSVCAVLVGCFNNPVIGAAMTTQHLIDVLAALIQVLHSPDLCTHSRKKLTSIVWSEPREGTSLNLESPGDVGQHVPNTSDESVKEKCSFLLEQVLNLSYQPLVVQQLLFLQGPPSSSNVKQGIPSKRPSWLGKACGQLLSERLMMKNGVGHVVSGIMESTSALPMPQAVMWRKCKAVAGILATPPSTVSSLEHYYMTICPQILKLLRDKCKNEEYLRVATETMSLMLKKNRKLGDAYLLQPFLKPLEKLLDCSSVLTTQLVGDIQKCIQLLHKISGVAEPSSQVLASLLPNSIILFKLWQFLPKQDAMSVSCKEILERVLASASNTDVLDFLCSVCSLPKMSKTFKTTPSWSMSISYSGHPPQLSITRSSDLSELDKMESSCDLVINLLQTTLHSRALVGHFFAMCMEFLASILSKDVQLEGTASSSQKFLNSGASSVLLECEQAMPKSNTAMLCDTGVLYITAALVENLNEEILRTIDTSRLLKSCRTIFECHVKRIGEFEDVRLIPGQSVTMEITGGSVSLSLCCGLVSAMMSKSESIGEYDRTLLTSLRHPLDQLAANYPDTELCALAGDISVCIATLGAVWSSEGESHATDFKKGTNQMAKKVKAELKQTLEHSICEGDTGAESSSVLPEKRINKTLYQDAIKDLVDPMVPVRGHGLIALTRLIYAKDKETLSNAYDLLEQFKKNLGHSDSYIYLAAINALVALALATPQTYSEGILTTLCQEYANLSSRPDPGARFLYEKDTGQHRKGSVPKTLTNHGVEVRMKLGEALVKIFQELSEMLPHYLNDIVASLLTTVRDDEPLLRASSLSNIAELCCNNMEMIDHLLTEMLSCVSHVLRSDKESPVRQAALVVLRNIIRGSNITSERGEELCEIYHLLKQTESTELDDLTRAHAQGALGELDTKMRMFIFPSERKLEKSITILP